MIVTAFVVAVVGWIEGVLSLLPTGGPTSAAAPEAWYSGFLFLFIPAQTIAQAMGVLLVWSAALAAARFTVWALTLFHVAGGQG